MMYRVNGLTAASAATVDHGVACLWNPHATKRIKVTEISLVAVTAPGAGAGVELRRCTARGTPGSTVTPGIQNADERDIAPPSGALLDLATYSVQPTLEANGLWNWVLGAVIGSGFIYPIALGETVVPGSGLVLVNRAGIIIPACEVTFAWEE
jgi:hypothetical protein